MKRFLTAISLLACLLVPASAAAAYNPLNNACHAGGSANSSAACSDNSTDNPLTGPKGIIKKVSTMLAILAAIAAVILIIFGGFRYITSGGDSQKTTSARNTIVGAVVGLAIIAVAQAIVVFVVSKL